MAQSPSLTPNDGLVGRLRSDRANALLMLGRLDAGQAAPKSADYDLGDRVARALGALGAGK